MQREPSNDNSIIFITPGAPNSPRTSGRSVASIATLAILLLAAAVESPSQSFTRITTGPPVTETGAWRSVNWVDYDRDGDLDLFVTRGLAGGQNNVLFRNEGGPGFSFTRMSGLVISQDGLSSDGSTWADYDNDGYPDAFVANWYNQNNLLYHNDGNGAFTRILSGPAVNDGGYSETASWGDYNNDGLVDVYVANSGGNRLNFLYKNAGAGAFVKITTGRQSTDAGTSRGVNWVDYDDDGDLDLFVTNEGNENEFLYRNMLLESGVDTFQRVLTGPLVNAGGSSWSGSWADYDNDGDQDVFVTNNTNQPGALFVNGGGGVFTADTATPLATDLGYGASAHWGDFDNDADQDLIVTHAYSGGATVNFMYKNLLTETDTARLERVLTGPVVTDAGFIYGASWGDYDGDGDLDLFTARTRNESQVNAFYSNDGTLNHWLTLDLRGTASNAAAIGAKVRARAVLNGTPVWQLRVVEGQSGYCGQNLQLHFGLLDAVSVDSLVIEWPSGNVETFTGVAADRHLVVVENDSTPVTPVSPGNGYLNDAPDVLLKWNRSLHYPPYRIQVSTDPGFAGGIVADTIAGGDTTAFVRVVSNLDRYYWRVTPARSIHGSIWSATRYFDNDVQLPAATQGIAPANGAVNTPVSSQLRWARAARATSYRVRLGSDSLFATTLLDTSVADTTINPGILPFLTQYFWDVQSENFTGPGPASALRSFTTIIQAPGAVTLASPSDEEINVGVPATLVWISADRAATYQVQVSAESLFIPPLVRDLVIPDTSIIVTGLGSYQSYYWRARSFNAGGQTTYTAFRRFRTVIAAPALLEPPEGSSQFTIVSFEWAPSPPATAYRLQYGTDSLFVTVEFDDSTLTETGLTSSSLQSEVRYFWRTRAQHPAGVSPWSATRSFYTALDTFLYSATAAWNLASLPGNVADRNAAVVYPGALTPFYRYDTGYVGEDTLEYGRGYWVRLAPDASIPIAGTKRLLDTIDVLAGWNLVGALSQPLPVVSVITVPGGLTSSPFYGFSGGFHTEDTLRPGQGYWIRMDQPGKLVLNISGPFASHSALRPVTDGVVPPPPPGDIVATGPAVPERAALEQNYPNPFNPSTEIRFQVPRGTAVRLGVYNATGELVAELVDAHTEAGYHSIGWNATGFPSGIYYARLVAGPHREVRKMLLLK